VDVEENVRMWEGWSNYRILICCIMMNRAPYYRRPFFFKKILQNWLSHSTYSVPSKQGLRGRGGGKRVTHVTVSRHTRENGRFKAKDGRRSWKLLRHDRAKPMHGSASRPHPSRSLKRAESERLVQSCHTDPYYEHPNIWLRRGFSMTSLTFSTVPQWVHITSNTLRLHTPPY
jgi:hypothetical protein